MGIRSWLRQSMVLLAGCCAVWSGAGAQTLSMGVSDGPVSLPIYVAQANGYFEREGLNLSIHSCSSGRDCYKKMADGTVQIATAAELIATLNSFNRQDLAFIATISASSSQIKIVARRSAGIATASQVAGKRVGTVQGSSAAYFLTRWLSSNNPNARDSRLVPLEPGNVVAALQRGDIDAAAIWEPVASHAFAALGSNGLLLENPALYTQQFGLIVSRALIKAQEADLLKLLRGLLQAERFIAEQPEKAEQVLMARLGGTRAQAAAQMREHAYRLGLDVSLAETMDGQARWAIQEVQVQPKPDTLLHVIEPALLRKVAPEAVQLRY
ncbi:ABC transporter substrate-binding protein [Rhodoferax sp.]|uniref:ABC transporter substrate-binding protein n=1 Tax=Rhodoferax sp. TaxID=50421 RepID=UPI00374CE1AA